MNSQVNENPTKTDRRIAWFLIVATLLVFGNGMFGAMMFDDHKSIRDREIIHSLWPVTPMLTKTRRPSLMVTLAANYAISGARPWSYHVLNIASHCLAGLLLFDLSRRILRQNADGSPWRIHASWIAAAIALLWLLHPLQTQAVTYIIQRSESMMALCYLLCFYCLMRSADSRRAIYWNLGVIAAFACGMGFKSVIVSAPLVLILFDYFFLSRNWKELVRRRWFVYAAMLPIIVLLLSSMRNTLDPNSTSSIGNAAGVSSWAFLRTQAEVILHYIALSFWPAQLCLDYRWEVQNSAAVYLTCGLVVVSGLLASLATMRWTPRIGYVGLAFFLVLAPTSSFVPITDLAFEHRMYLPLAALVILSVCGFAAITFRIWPDERLQKQIFVGVCLVAGVALGARTIVRNCDYYSEIAMWRSVVAARPANSRGYFNLAVTLAKDKQLAEAERNYLSAIEIDSEYAKAHYNLALLYAKLKKSDLAMDHYHKALTARPTYADAAYNLAVLLERLGRLDQAAEYYQAALNINPQYRNASYNLAGVFGKMRRLGDAISQYDATLLIDPQDSNASFNKASLLYKTKRYEEAIDQYQRTLEIQEDHHNARLIMATILVELGRAEEAEQCYLNVLAEDPRNLDVSDQFGVFLARQKEFERAIEQFTKVLRMHPRHVPALMHLGAAQEANGDDSAAIATFRKVLQLQPDLASAEDSLARLLAPRDPAQGNSTQPSGSGA